jgi:SPW repeat-containing protein
MEDLKMINSRVHGAIDYVVGILLILAPYLLGFADGSAAQLVPQILGALVLVMSLLTAYEFSLAKVIPYRIHLGVDVVQALLLIASPWLFGFADRIWWPHVVVGILEVVVVALSWGRATSSAGNSFNADPAHR